MQGSTIPFRPVEVQLDATAFTVASGSSVAIPFALINHTANEDYFDISIQGIPANWVLLDIPVMHLAPGERREASLTIQAPGTSPLSEGVYPVVLRATSQSDQGVSGEAGFDLRVAGYETTMQATPYVSGGRVEVRLAATQFSVASGESLAIPVQVSNHGAFEDTFYLTVDGAPGRWASGPAQAAPLAPGESHEIILLIQPPVGTPAGQYPFRLRVTSQADPSQYTVVDAELNIVAGYAPVNQFTSDLAPRHMDAGRTARVLIHNLSSAPDTYTVRWQSPQGDLEFVPSGPGPVQVLPGQTGAVDFTVSPRSPNWFGQPATLPYTVLVQSAGGETQRHNGEVVSRALIPVWVLPALLVLCLTAFCGVGFLWNWNQNRLSGAKATSQAQSALDAQSATINAAVTATAGVSATAAAAATINMAATLAIPLPTATFTLLPPTLTGTPVPSATLPPATFTPQPTATLTPLPTSTNTPAATIPPPTATNTVPPTIAPPTSTVTFTPAPVIVTPTPKPGASATPAAAQTSTPGSLPVTGQQLVVFVSNRDGSPHLYLFNTADGSVKPLTSGSSTESDPAWSPDGTKIAFTTNRDGNDEIYVMNADGSNPVNLTRSPGDDRYPAWSPDGTKIAFTTNRDGNNEIYVMNADGSNPVNLTRSPANDSKPVWYTQRGLLSSTSRIVFTTDRDGNNEIYSMNVDGSNATNLTKNPASDSLPDVPFSGGKIAFVSNRDGNNEIYVMGLDGSGPANLTKNPADDSMPVWSPDGKWIAFTTNRDGNQEIYVMAADGSQATNLTRSPASDLEPAWR